MTNFNERTNTLLYKNISLTLYSWKGWCWLCVRGELSWESICYNSIWWYDQIPISCTIPTRGLSFPPSHVKYLYFYYYYCYYNYFTPWEFFTPVLTNDLSLVSEWQQVSLGLQDSSQYSGQSQQCYSLNGLNSSSSF